MLCSKCSNPIRPVVAIDIDGTLGNYHGHFYDFMIGYTGVLPSDKTLKYQGDEPYSDYISRNFGCSLDQFRAAKLAYRQGAYKRTMPTYPGAMSLVKLLYPVCELWITTTRPYMRVDQIDPDTQEWLFRNQMPFHGLLFHEDKYQVLADRIDVRRVVAVVDDLKENLDSASALFGDHIPIQFATVYNRASRFSPHSGNHDKIRETIQKRIQVWEEAVHGQ
jgi:hypothetical protein